MTFDKSSEVPKSRSTSISLGAPGTTIALKGKDGKPGFDVFESAGTFNSVKVPALILFEL